MPICRKSGGFKVDSSSADAKSSPNRPTMMRAAVFSGRPEDGLRVAQVEKPKPAIGQVLIKVHACGICYTDVAMMYGEFHSWGRYPVVPGHEVMGVVAEVGPGTSWPPVGTKVGMPFLFDSCNHCDYCVRGDQILCSSREKLLFTGLHVNGGFAEYMLAPATHVIPIPDELDLTKAAPLMCAGVTVFNGLRRAGLKFGDRVAILGTGGLGQLGIQFARAMGGTVAAVSRSRAAEKVARELGASHYIASAESPVAEALQKWGGANVIINTAPSTQTANEAVGGLAPDGTLVILGLDEHAVSARPEQLVMARQRIMGLPSGSPHDVRDTLRFVIDHGIMPQVTPVKLEDADTICKNLFKGTQKGRSVIVFE